VVAVGVVFGGPSPEHDVSILTGLQASRELLGAGREVRAIYWTKSGDWVEVEPGAEASSFFEGTPAAATPLRLVATPGGGFVAQGKLGRTHSVALDAVVMCCHGGPGEDGSLQSTLDLAGVAYTGPSAWAAALGMDKLAFAGVAAAAGMACLPRAELSGLVGFEGPYLVKPRFGGSSIGVQAVTDLESARALGAASPHLRRGAVIEPYRQDLHDLNIAVRTWPEVSLSQIERPERSSEGAEILSYADKYVGGEGMVSAPRELPAKVSPAVAEQVRDTARALVSLVGIRGIVRVDFLASESGELYLNEVNTIPGSLSKYLWVDPAVAFLRLLDDMVAEALARPAASYSSVGADGRVLRSAGSIQAKLG
jgi:D-alanine-D-alanine ligase